MSTVDNRTNNFSENSSFEGFASIVSDRYAPFWTRIWVNKETGQLGFENSGGSATSGMMMGNKIVITDEIINSFTGKWFSLLNKWSNEESNLDWAFDRSDLEKFFEAQSADLSELRLLKKICTDAGLSSSDSLVLKIDSLKKVIDEKNAADWQEYLDGPEKKQEKIQVRFDNLKKVVPLGTKLDSNVGVWVLEEEGFRHIFDSGVHKDIFNAGNIANKSIEDFEKAFLD